MRYLSLFSGIGGFELGIQQAYESNNEHAHLSEKSEQEERTQGRVGSTNLHEVLLHAGDGTAPLCVGYSEIDKYAIATYQSHFPAHHNYGDITKIDARELPDFDLLVGGFPCQSFSIAGHRRGFDDTRGTLFFDIARLLKEKQPRLCLLENVKGLLSHDEGRTFRVIISTLDELGYDIQWQLLNSKNHGVPQNRERVFIIGHLRGTSRPEVFTFGCSDNQTNANTEIQQLNQPTHSNDRVYGSDGIAPTLNTMQGGNRQPFIQNPKMMNYKKDYENSVAITAISYKEPPVVSGIRRLTPTECERLQGFPDNWTIGSDTQRYKQCGNAVTVNVIKDIVEKLLFNTRTITGHVGE